MYRIRRRQAVTVVIVLSCVSAGVVLGSLAWGTPTLSVGKVIDALFGAAGVEDSHRFIVRELRLPRVIGGALAGAMLGASGAVMQDTLRNPLAGPELIGVSAGASLAVATIVAFRIPLPRIALPIAALVAGLITGTLILALVSLKRNPMHMLLAGAALTALINALVIAVITLAPNFGGVSIIYRFLVGSLSDVQWDEIRLASPWAIALVLVVLLAGRPLNVLKLGDEVAEGLGVGVRRTRALLFAASVLLVAPVIAIAGPIGFIALVAPHIVRRLLRTSDARVVIPVAAVTGAVLVLAADTAARLALHPHEVAVGLWTALLGAPTLLVLLQRSMFRKRPSI
ncbi:MAG: iron ABC transporter permease [Acidimicrobiia bacterium]|nr:iron ABC transporter permease [Acidimicrobiia bacterium]MYC46427.1 iron ABC transporter permease [Acidimicrobiia bacterium]